MSQPQTLEIRPSPIPVILLTGFLGAGKTTIINWLIEHFSDRKLSVLLNEFGDISLESRFIVEGGLEVAEIANGCMCCAARDDIPLAIRYIMEHAPQTKHLLIEASGLSDPEPIRTALSSGFESNEIDADVSHWVRLETTVCVVDALNFLKTRQEYQIVNSQLGDAELVILNKTQLAGPELTNQVRQVITAMTPQARVFDFDAGFPGSILFEPELHLEESVNHETSHNHDHQHQPISEFWYRSEGIFNQLELTYFLRSLPHNIFRVKGMVQVEAPTGKTTWQLVSCVAGRVQWQSPATNDETTSNPSATAILFLGQEINQPQLRQGLDECKL